MKFATLEPDWVVPGTALADHFLHQLRQLGNLWSLTLKLLIQSQMGWTSLIRFGFNPSFVAIWCPDGHINCSCLCCLTMRVGECVYRWNLGRFPMHVSGVSMLVLHSCACLVVWVQAFWFQICDIGNVVVFPYKQTLVEFTLEKQSFFKFSVGKVTHLVGKNNIC
jgi:hypothetical protein